MSFAQHFFQVAIHFLDSCVSFPWTSCRSSRKFRKSGTPHLGWPRTVRKLGHVPQRMLYRIWKCQQVSRLPVCWGSITCKLQDLQVKAAFCSRSSRPYEWSQSPWLQLLMVVWDAMSLRSAYSPDFKLQVSLHRNSQTLTVPCGRNKHWYFILRSLEVGFECCAATVGKEKKLRIQYQSQIKHKAYQAVKGIGGRVWMLKKG